MVSNSFITRLPILLLISSPLLPLIVEQWIIEGSSFDLIEEDCLQELIPHTHITLVLLDEDVLVREVLLCNLHIIHLVYVIKDPVHIQSLLHKLRLQIYVQLLCRR